MSYPQPDSDKYVIGGLDYFRLNTLIQSPGDIYESKSGGYAIAIGPESDIAEVDIAYFDNVQPPPPILAPYTLTAPSFINKTRISPSRAFLGRIDARNEATYAPSSRPGRILFWSANLFDPLFESGLQPATVYNRISPRLDVIQYFSPPGSLTPQRNDKTYYFQELQQGIASGDTLGLVIPYYGRRYANVDVGNGDAVSNLTFLMEGINYVYTDDVNPPVHQETALGVISVIGPAGHVKRIVRASVDGMFDALYLRLQFGDGSMRTPVKIRLSDTED